MTRALTTLPPRRRVEPPAGADPAVPAAKEPGRLTSSRTLAVAMVLVVATLCVVDVVHPDGWIGIWAFDSVTVGAGVLAWVSVLRWGGPIRLWLAIGISASALGDVSWDLYMAVRGTAPDISVADIGYIAAYVGVTVAVLKTLRRGDRRTRRDVDGLIDMAIIALAGGLLLWELWVRSTVSDSSVPVFVRAIWAAYPMLDAALLAVVIRALGGRRVRALPGFLLFGGVSCWLVADFVWMNMPDATGLVASLLDVGWMIGAALMAAACWSLGAEPPAVSTAEVEERPVGKARIALAIMPFFVPGAIEIVSYSQGRDVNPVPMLLATVAFAGLAGARAFRLLALRDRVQARLASSERLYRALAANSSDAVMILDADGRIMNDAPNLAALIGYPGEPTRGRRALDFVSKDDVDSARLFDESVMSPGVVLSGEARVARDRGTDQWLSIRGVNLLHDPDVNGIVVNVHDITDRKRAEDELLHRAFHDSLTGLANRALFRDRIEHALKRRGRTGFDPAVIYLDIDGFKNVNDSLGHEAGDSFLRQIGERLRSIVRSGDTVARLGGDEFAVLIEESPHVDVEAEEIADRALQAFTEPVSLGKERLTLSASLGIAHAEPDSTASSLLRDADIAMYQAKAAGKGRWIVYEPTMRAAAVERARMENDLGQAVEKQQLRLVYQPIVELETSRIVGFEALVRWDHPELGTVMPEKFIPIAEENGMIVDIGDWVLRQACVTAAGWRERYPDGLTMAVNLSARQLASAHIVDDVREALRVSRLDPAALVLEMTETALVRDTTMAAARLHELRQLGVRLAIDDFGTGYSSLTYLRQFPVDILKIDRSFTMTIHDRMVFPPIVRGLLDLGKTLDLEVVAEGIESGMQRDQLRDQQCKLGQGFLFAEPLRPEEAARLLESLAPVATELT